MRSFTLTLLLMTFSIFAVERNTVAPISPEMQQALAKGLKFLASKQSPDGCWVGKYGKNVGETSLCLMAFMALGNLPGEGEYGHIAGKGVQWVLNQAKPSGLIQFSGQQTQGPAMYGHALSTLMLSEVWGQTRRKDVGKVLRNAVNLILQVQGPKGGWGYRSVPKDGDTSVCVMQIFALKSAQDAGIYVPSATIQKALNLIKSRFNEDKKRFGYGTTKLLNGQLGSSAAGTCIMQICGEKEKKYTKGSLEQLHIIMKNGLDSFGVGHKPYFLYYTSVASFNAGNDFFRPWVQKLEPYLIKSQRYNGSWGAHYQTAFSILAGSLAFQYIPVYQK
jgi:hypothetical protein